MNHLSTPTASWEAVPQAHPRRDFGVRITITPYRRSASHMITHLSGPLLTQLGWTFGQHFGLHIQRDADMRPVKARLFPLSGQEGGRMLWRSGGRGYAGTGSVSFKLPDDMAKARVGRIEPSFRVDFETDQPGLLTFVLPRLRLTTDDAA